MLIAIIVSKWKAGFAILSVFYAAFCVKFIPSKHKKLFSLEEKGAKSK